LLFACLLQWGKFLGGGKNLPLAQADGSANRRPSIFPSAGGAAEPLLSILGGIVQRSRRQLAASIADFCSKVAAASCLPSQRSTVEILKVPFKISSNLLIKGPQVFLFLI